MSDSAPPPASPGAAPEAVPDAGRRRWPWALVAGLIVGLFAGGAIVAGFDINGDTNKHTVQARATPSASPVPDSSPSSGTDVHIDQSCLQAISDAEQIYGQLGQLVNAASSLNAASLDTVIRRLEALERTLRPAATACRATVVLPSALPTPSLSGVPTVTVSPAR